MKRMVSLLLCVVLLMTVCSLSVSAAPSNSVTFTVTANDAKVGETVNVVVSISENSYFTNATVYMHYDSAVMEYVSDSLGAVAPKSAMYLSNNFADRGYVKMAYVAINGLQKGGELWVFEFKVLSKAASEFTVSFDECVGADDDNNEFNLNYTVVPCIVNNNGQTAVTTTTAKAPATTQKTTTVTNGDVVTTTTASSSDDEEDGNNDVTTTTLSDGKTTVTGDAATATTTAKVTKSTTTTKKAVAEEDMPKTGDNSLALMAAVIGVVALAVVGATIIVKKIRD